MHKNHTDQKSLKEKKKDLRRMQAVKTLYRYGGFFSEFTTRMIYVMCLYF